MSNKKYWKGYDELNNTPAFQKSKRNEFAEELPLVSELKQVATEQRASRRDFLKVLGFSTGAALVAASCEIPIKKAIPYVNKPEEIIPGIANYYASSFVNGRDYCSVLVKTREGRPIKIEGNQLSGLTKGGTSARAQASVVSLYDGARLTAPKIGGKKTSWENVDKEIVGKLRSAGKLVLLTCPIISPTAKEAIKLFQRKYNADHIVYDPVSKSGALVANERSFGKRVMPSYNFDKADVIVGIGADFLGTWVSPVEFTKQYISRRRVTPESPVMSKHWQFESYMSTTGGNADKRLSVKPSQLGLVAAALHNAVAGGGKVSGLDAKVQEAINKTAVDLKAARGKALVVCGSNDPNVQQVVNAINEQLGSYGSTIDLDKPYTAYEEDDQKMIKLVNDMKSGAVGGLIVWNVNPAYSFPKSEDFIAGLKKLKLSVSFNQSADETAENIQYLCPDSHYLEAWNDAEPKKGYYSLGQPTIAPLFDTRQAPESLLRWAGENTNYYDFLRTNWESKIFSQQSKLSTFQEFWDVALHNGVFEADNAETTLGSSFGGAIYAAAANGGGNAIARPVNNRNRVAAAQANEDTAPAEEDGEVVSTPSSGGGNVSSAISAITSAAGKASGIELVVFENITIGDGRYANNPFLQETPEPISKTCWDNVLAVSALDAKANGWNELDLIEVSANGHTIQLPMIFQPGQLKGTVSIALGYGRTKPGTPLCAVGQNAYPFISTKGETFDYNVLTGVSLNKVGSEYPLGLTQTHHSVDDTGILGNERPIVREATIEEYKKDKYAGNHVTEHFKSNLEKHFFTLYGEDDAYGSHADLIKGGHHWGIAVDLTTCTGCSACVTACNVENNVPIVGQEEVFRAHEMHWMRIDRYYSGDRENPDVTFMPMMCQHCDNAPCENVCPVAATNHSSEGLNQMAYNRCIGTRYCANNCPFKVRRFNWFDYQGADSFYIWDNDEGHMLMDDLSRMVLNPDVTVRSRGVMEKCSFCVQRIQEGKLTAKKEGRKLKDGDIKTACQTSCPADAIVFGDMNDKESQVSKLKAQKRNYNLLDEIHVVPSVSYLVQFRNREPEAHDGHHGKGHSKSGAEKHS